MIRARTSAQAIALAGSARVRGSRAWLSSRPRSGAMRSSSTVRAVPRAGVGDDGHEMLPGTDALRIKYKGALPALLEERTDLTREGVEDVLATRLILDAAVPPDGSHRRRHRGSSPLTLRSHRKPRRRSRNEADDDDRGDRFGINYAPLISISDPSLMSRGSLRFRLRRVRARTVDRAITSFRVREFRRSA